MLRWKEFLQEQAVAKKGDYDFGNLKLTEMYIGKSGLGHIAHDYETDIADSSMLVWVKSKMIQITVSGVTLYGILEQVEDW